MAIHDVTYIELYTSDYSSVLDYFVSSVGFAPVMGSSDSAGHSVLLRQGGVQLVITEGPETEAFLEAHGDGIADIAFSCDEVTETRDKALTAGASLVKTRGDSVAVSGLGDVRHTLVTRQPAGALPPGRAWTNVPRSLASRPAQGRIGLLDHVAVCVAAGTLAHCADFYTAGFELARYSSEYTEMGQQAMESIVVRSPTGGVTFTLLAQDMSRKPGQIQGFISRNDGPGVQHLAFAVDDIVSAVHDFNRRGVSFLKTPDAYYDLLTARFPDIGKEIADLRTAAVLIDRDEWGYLLQLFTRSPHQRNTLFYEFIERKGARGFGSANIKALYEAVERDGLGAE